MACKTVCRLCPSLILSQAVTFADGTLTITLPAGSYVVGMLARDKTGRGRIAAWSDVYLKIQ